MSDLYQIAKSKEFCELPATTRCLYYMLDTFADENGIAKNPRKLMQDCGASDEDMKTLLKANYIVLVDGTNDVGVIKNTWMSNFLTSLKSPAFKNGDAKQTFYDAVKLTQSELTELRNKFGDALVQNQMQRLANFIKKDGKALPNHYGTLTRWCEDEKKKNETEAK